MFELRNLTEGLSFLFSFKGRISRRDYWLRGILPGVALAVLVELVSWLFSHYRSFSASNVLHNLALGQMSWIMTAVHVKRLHDMGKSGWWLLTAFFPIIGWTYFVIIIVSCAVTEGSPGYNEYGNDPDENSLREDEDEPPPFKQAAGIRIIRPFWGKGVAKGEITSHVNAPRPVDNGVDHVNGLHASAYEKQRVEQKSEPRLTEAEFEAEMDKWLDQSIGGRFLLGLFSLIFFLWLFARIQMTTQHPEYRDGMYIIIALETVCSSVIVQFVWGLKSEESGFVFAMRLYSAILLLLAVLALFVISFFL